jgi:hypothetical protein
VVVKNTRSPSLNSKPATFVPVVNCSETVRGTGMPCCPKTYQTKPLQSKPLVSTPPFRYGTPRSESAVPLISYPPVRTRGVAVGVVPAFGNEAVGGSAVPGMGKGRGVAPVVAHPAESAATTISRPRMGSEQVIG